MNSIAIVALAAVGLIAIIYIAYKMIWAFIIKRNAEAYLKAVLPIWAAQWPFNSGAESANALMAAWYAYYGLDSMKEAQKVFNTHKEQYDKDPDNWIQVYEACQARMKNADPSLVQLAKSYAAMENLNDDFIGEKGFKLELADSADGDTHVVARDIESGEVSEIPRQEQEDDPVLKMGSYILDSDLDEGKELLEFLTHWHKVAKASAGVEIDEDTPLTAEEIGKLYQVLLDYINNGVESGSDIEGVVQQFAGLRNAYEAAIREGGNTKFAGVNDHVGTDKDSQDQFIIDEGTKLLQSESKEGKELLKYVVDVVNMRYEDEPITAYKIGHTYGLLLSLKNGGVQDKASLKKVVKKFGNLYDAYASTLRAM